MLQAASLNWENCIVILLTIQSHENYVIVTEWLFSW